MEPVRIPAQCQYRPISAAFSSLLHRLDGRARLVLFTTLILTITLVQRHLGWELLWFWY